MILHAKLKLPCMDVCISSFAWVLHLALRRAYGGSEDSDLLEYSFHYPGVPKNFTLQCLASSAEECLAFLQSLWKVRGRKDGSVYFYTYGGARSKAKLSPWNYIAEGNWMLILPYGVVAALVRHAHSEVLRKDAATKYFIQIPIWYEGRWHYWSELASEVEYGKGKQKAGYNSNCLSVVPHSALAEYPKTIARLPPGFVHALPKGVLLFCRLLCRCVVVLPMRCSLSLRRIQMNPSRMNPNFIGIHPKWMQHLSKIRNTLIQHILAHTC